MPHLFPSRTPGDPTPPRGDVIRPIDGADPLLRTLIQASPLAICLLDLDGRIQLWNSAAERIFGWRAAEVLGRQAVEQIGGRTLLQLVLGGESLTQAEVRCRRRDGTLIDVALSTARLADEAGGAQGVMAIAADITDRRRMEAERAELLQREQQSRALAEAAAGRARLLAEGSALLNTSLDYHTTFANLARLTVPVLADYCLIDELQEDMLCRVAVAHTDPQRERLLRREQRQPLADSGYHPSVQVALKGEPVLVEEVTEAVLDALSHDSRHRRLLQRLALHSFLIVPLIARGRILGTLTLVAAESKRRFTHADLDTAEELARRAAVAIDTARLYHQARQAVQARERMLAVVSHDLRNSLATVLLNASALLDAGALDPAHAEQLEWVARSAEQMNRLINDLLDVSSIEAGRFSIEAGPHEVELLLREAVALHRPVLADKRIRAEVELPAATPRVLVDRERIQQVLGNLIGNAVKFSPPGAFLGLSARVGGDEVRFSVRDSGPGIPPEHLGSIFDLYWQGRRGRRTGAGLGLSISRAIVEAHGGRIWVDSEPGLGSTFHFTVPAVPPAA